MTLLFVVLSFLVFVSASISIYLRHNNKRKAFAIFKPLTTIIIIAIAILIFYTNGSNYSLVIIIGLIAALIGDVFLISEKYFLQGLSSFLVAHIIFIYAFASIFGFNWNFIPLIALIPIAVFYFKFINKNLGSFKIPVAIYISIIMIMNWQAIGLLLYDSSIIYFALGIGSLLFSFSDAIISYNKFVSKFALAEVLILSTYWMAIYIFAIAGLFI
ncbi:MAG: lysoplasmalogenase [Bacteroidales bacterium]|nr:lysoplasmalogenase [Bacteroidales bacterium]